MVGATSYGSYSISFSFGSISSTFSLSFSTFFRIYWSTISCCISSPFRLLMSIKHSTYRVLSHIYAVFIFSWWVSIYFSRSSKAVSFLQIANFIIFLLLLLTTLGIAIPAIPTPSLCLLTTQHTSQKWTMELSTNILRLAVPSWALLRYRIITPNRIRQTETSFHIVLPVLPSASTLLMDASYMIGRSCFPFMPTLWPIAIAQLQIRCPLWTCRCPSGTCRQKTMTTHSCSSRRTSRRCPRLIVVRPSYSSRQGRLAPQTAWRQDYFVHCYFFLLPVQAHLCLNLIEKSCNALPHMCDWYFSRSLFSCQRVLLNYTYTKRT